MGPFTGQDLGVFFGAEFLGTFILLLLGNAVVAGGVLKGTKNPNAKWLLFSFAWMLAVFTGAAASGTIIANYIPQTLGRWSLPSGLLNPVFTINNFIVNLHTGSSGLPVAFFFVGLIAQLLGAAVGQLFVVMLFWPQYKLTEDQGSIAATFHTGPSVRNYKFNFLTEVVATFMLVLLIAFVAGNAQIQTATGSTMVVGWIILAIALSLGTTTAYSLNPARDFMPRVILQLVKVPNKGKVDWSYAWVGSLGPITGGIIGVLVTPGLFY
ncbi:MIP/aquaporin family protein [Mycoplasmopsis agassizii]|uniref:MIP/aquaporin family protein n=1 Tax=Mycoplasmopsis agassizii TaxID=33922 RepID=UPI0035271B06